MWKDSPSPSGSMTGAHTSAPSRVTHDLSLSIAPGQVVAVVGSSGSGKSLLAHALLDILPANSARAGIHPLPGGAPHPRPGRRPAGA